MLYLESPKGVGFSYCEGVKSSSACVNTDESTALDAYEFLVNFFNLYPEFKSNRFLITGESYAGIYIPMLIDQVLSLTFLFGYRDITCFCVIDRFRFNEREN